VPEVAWGGPANYRRNGVERVTDEEERHRFALLGSPHWSQLAWCRMGLRLDAHFEGRVVEGGLAGATSGGIDYLRFRPDDVGCSTCAKVLTRGMAGSRAASATLVPRISNCTRSGARVAQ
jgi:hypothetical protein